VSAQPGPDHRPHRSKVQSQDLTPFAPDPVCPDLERILLGYIEVAKITEGPLFRTAIRRTKQLTTKAVSGIDI
jgi:hypothetical protein